MPDTTYGRPPMAGVASTMMSPPIFISPSWKMPSLLMSITDSSAGSTLLQAEIQSGKLVERRAHQHVEHLVLDQHRQGRRREVQQEDEEQAPGHRLARLLHRRRGVVAHQDVRQRGRADHQAEHQRQEVAPRHVEGLLAPSRRRSGRRRTSARARGMPASGSARAALAALAAVQAFLASSAVLRQRGQRLLGGLHVGGRAVGGLQVVELLLRGGLVGRQRGGHVLQLGVEAVGALP